MRNTWWSSNTVPTSRLRATADGRSVPNGFSMITRERSDRPVSPSMRTTVGAADGGMLR